jgi:hypothetical protein
MRTRLIVNLLLPLCLTGCYYQETAATRIIHAGDDAVLICHNRAEVPLALRKGDAHPLARAVESGNEAAIRALADAGRAVLVPAWTKVVVTRESFNERYVEIREGPHAGKAGWIPFEWLRPPQSAS